MYQLIYNDPVLASLADRLARLERRLAAVEEIVLPRPEPTWWEIAYPKAYPQKEFDHG